MIIPFAEEKRKKDYTFCSDSVLIFDKNQMDLEKSISLQLLFSIWPAFLFITDLEENMICFYFVLLTGLFLITTEVFAKLFFTYLLGFISNLCDFYWFFPDNK